MYTELEMEDIKRVATSNFISFATLRNKTILISGGTGLIGSFLVEVIKYRNEYFDDNIKVISLSRSGGENETNVIRKCCDVTRKIIIDDEIDFIIHLASNTHPIQYENDPVGTILTNVLGCNNLLEIGVKKKICKFLLASSVEIYGQGDKYPIDEKYNGYIDCNQIRSGYNEAKRLSELLCLSYSKQYNVNISIARFSRVIGPDKKIDSKAMSQFMDKALANEDIILKSKGHQLFSYCYVSDAVSGLLKVLIDGKHCESYNISGDFDNMTLGKYAEYIAKLANKKVIYEIENNDNVSKASYAVLDTKKLKKLGWYPYYSICDALKRIYLIKKSIKK